MKDIAEQEVIDLEDMDVEAFNEFAARQGWSDGMPLYIPTEEKVAKFVATVRGDNRPYPPVPPRQIVPTVQALAANAVMAGVLGGLVLYRRDPNARTDKDMARAA
jgi:hypothetical protein